MNYDMKKNPAWSLKVMTRQQGPARSSSLKGCAIYYVFLMETLKGIRKKKVLFLFQNNQFVA